MILRNPSALFYLAAAIPIVVLFYFLRLKRETKVVSSTFLWRRSIQDLRVNAPFQRLRRNILLFLQILFLLLAGAASADPVLTDRGTKPRQVVLIIDRSASMGALLPDGRVRLDLARSRALDILDGLGRHDQAAALAFDQIGTTLCSMTRDIAAVRQSIEGLAPQDLPSDAREALQTADAMMAEAGADAEAYLISDGAIQGIDQVEVTHGRVYYLRTGEPGPNLGIVGIEVRRSIDVTAGDQLFVAVANGSPPPAGGDAGPAAEGILEVRVDGALFDARPVEVRPGLRGGLVFPIPAGGGVLEARLIPRGRDILAADDVAFAVLPERRPIDCVLVSPGGNYFLEHLLALDAAIRKDEDGNLPILRAPPDPTRRADVFIWDRVAPGGPLPPGGHLFIGVVPPLPGWSGGELLATPHLLDWDRGHPVTRFANLTNLAVAEAIRLVPPPAAVTIVSSDQGPLLVAEEVEGYRALAVAFDLYRSDWPIYVSFPVVLTNATRWLAGRFQAERTLHTGDPLLLAVETERGRPVAVVKPGGEVREATVPEGETEAFFGDTRAAGVYQVRYEGGASAPWGFSLADANETMVAPAESISFRSSDVQRVEADEPADLPIWRYLVMAGLAILLLEWWIYNRRVFV